MSTSHSSISSSLHRITELLSRIKYGNRGIFYYMTFSVVDHFFRQKETAWFVPDKMYTGRVGVEARVRVSICV